MTKSYNRAGAAQRLRELLGDGAPSRASLPALPIPYAIVSGRAIYEERDLVHYANQVKAKAIRRMGGRRRTTLSVISSEIQPRA